MQWIAYVFFFYSNANRLFWQIVRVDKKIKFGDRRIPLERDSNVENVPNDVIMGCASGNTVSYVSLSDAYIQTRLYYCLIVYVTIYWRDICRPLERINR